MKNTNKITRKTARTIAKELLPIVNKYIDPWDRDYRNITITETADFIYSDISGMQETLKAFSEAAEAINDTETFKTIADSAIWNY